MDEAIRNNIPLSTLTTMRLGGPARFLIACESVPMLIDAVRFARERSLRWILLGGGSNLIFPDEGFDGLVIKIELRGWQFREEEDRVILEAQAGEPWDRLVSESVAHGFSGIECLSGIPGLVGATPIQNVGAYGQDVAETIQTVRVLDLVSMEQEEIPRDECGFAYRTSRFKEDDRDRYIVTSVVYELSRDRSPVIRYDELRNALEHASAITPAVVREAVLQLRRRKSMVLDPRDPNSRSVGSFFLNPVVPAAHFDRLKKDYESLPGFPQGTHVKIPAAWLVEQAGFQRGFRKGGVGISSNHALALVNNGGTTAELLSLAAEIQRGVRKAFGISLEPEPLIVRSGEAG